MTPGSEHGAVEVVMVARVPLDGVEAFRRYEDAVLPLLARYGAQLERRLASRDGELEVHIVRFPSRAALEAYRADPDRAAQADLLTRSRAQTTTFEVS